YEISGSYEFGPNDAVTMEVKHKLNLSVPFVRVIWADGRHGLSTGEGAYAEVTARTTLTNQGIDHELPEETTLPREP
ncbi:MAG: hypothetical protein MI741_06840, partial [Rhodospirillales bacterium]|nr:hypothetical protein [Rhodospirillales bacterium]